MNPQEMAKKILKDKSVDEEWLKIRDEVQMLLDSDAPDEDKKILSNWAILETITMMCDGFEMRNEMK